MSDQRIDTLVAEVLASPKYRAVAPELVRALARRELAAQRSAREAIKAVKSKLHQVVGAYVDERPPVDDWLATLRAAAGAGDAALREACQLLMRRHASTRERLPFVERFYAEALAGIAPPRSVVDLGCGLNPLALPWMPLAPGATYSACDVDADLVAVVGGFLELIGVPGAAHVRDLVADPAVPPADLALALKLLPVLEQVERGAGARLLRAVDAPYILVSYPARSLGGRAKGMVEGYARQLEAAVAGQPWRLTRFLYPNELVYLIER